MDFLVNPWGAAMVGLLFLASDLVGEPLPPTVVSDIGTSIELPAMDFLARPI